MATIKTITIAINTRVEKFFKGMRRVRRSLGRITSFVGKMVKRIGLLGGAFAALALGGGIGLLLHQEQKLILQTTATADRLGILTERMAGLTFAAGQYRIQQNQLELGLQRMTRRVAEAAQGTGEAQAALKELQIDAERLVRLSPDQQFIAVAEAMQQVKNQSDRVRLGFKLFDSEGADLIRLMQGGRQEIERLLGRAEQLGLTFSRIDAARIEMMNRAFREARGLISGVFRQLAFQLAPFAIALANWFTEAGLAGGNMGQRVVDAFRGVLSSLAKVADFMNLLQGAWFHFQGITQSVALVVVSGLNAIGKGIEYIINLIPGLDVKFTGFLDSLVDGFARAAMESKASATAAIEAYTRGDSQRKVAGFFEELESRAGKAAKRFAADFAVPQTPQIPGAGGGGPGGQGRVIDLERVVIGSGGSRAEQTVRAPQLDDTNELLREIRDGMGGRAAAVAG